MQENSLVLACEKKDIALVQNVANKGEIVDVNFGHNDSESALFISCSEGPAEIVELLLKEENIDLSPTELGLKMPNLAVESCLPDVVRVLLEDGRVDPCCDLDLPLKENIIGMILKYGNKEIMDLFVLDGRLLEPLRHSIYGITRLHVAVLENKKSDILALLVDPLTEPNEEDDCHATPLEYAASLGNFEIFRILFSHPGVKPAPETLLHRAAHNGNTEILKLLLDSGVNVNATVKDRTALWIACAQGHGAFVQLLLDCPEIDTKESKYVYESIVSAAKGTALQVVISDNRFDVSTKNYFGHTPLAFSCRLDDTDTERFCALLNDPRVNPCDSETDDCTILCTVAEKSFKATKALLEDGRVDPLEGRHPPLQLAMEQGRTDIVLLLLENEAVANAFHADQNSDLFKATATGNLEKVKFLLNQDNIDVNQPGTDGIRPLHLACVMDQVQMLELLLSHPAIDPNIACNKEETALHKAARRNNVVSVMRLLARADIQPNLLNFQKESAFYVAESSFFHMVGKLLLACPRTDDSITRTAGKCTLNQLTTEYCDTESLLDIAMDPRFTTIENGTFRTICKYGHFELAETLLREYRIEPSEQLFRKTIAKLRKKKDKTVVKYATLFSIYSEIAPGSFLTKESHIEAVTKNLRARSKSARK